MMATLSKTLMRASYHSIRCATGGTIQFPAQLKELDYNLLTIQLTKHPKSKEHEYRQYGRQYTDHLLMADWSSGYGWHDPSIIPYDAIKLDPACTSLHYALQAFEGMKACIDTNDRIRIFRPERHIQRLNESCKALLFPTFEVDQFIQCLYELLKREKDWIPRQSDCYLYIRPTIISTYPYITIGKPQNVKLYVICSPVVPFYPHTVFPVSALASEQYIRSWPGNDGDKKLGSNYASMVRILHQVSQEGYSGVMWLCPDMKTGQYFVNGLSTMNQFFFWKNKEGENELITPCLDGTVFPGVTRDSVLMLARDWNRFKVSERAIAINEVIEAIEGNRMIEAFATGTAATVASLDTIGFQGKDYRIPLDKNDSEANISPGLAREFRETIINIQYGEAQYKDWSVIVPN